METKPKVLIAKEEAPICKLFEIMLNSRGFQCAIAQNARQAMNLLKESDFAAALLDIRLPGTRFDNLLAQIESLHSSISIIVLSDNTEIKVAVDTMKAGAADYITEPFDLNQVANAVQTALDRKYRRKQTPNGEPADETVAGIEAVALGVEARQEILDGHSEIIIQQTIDIARQMGFPEEKIQSWVSGRMEKRSRRIKQLTDPILKLTPILPTQNVSVK